MQLTGLLTEIQDAAVSSTVPLSDLLRKCKILATRIGNKEFLDWVDLELGGYRSGAELPDYRKLVVHSKGDFAGAFGSGLRNAHIPPVCLPEKLRPHVNTNDLVQAASTLEDLLRSSETEFRSPWDADVVALFGGQIYQDMTCMQAWRVIPRGEVVRVVDSIRTRILNFALELGTADPGAGERGPTDQTVPPERVSQVFHTTIMGSVGNVISGSHDFTANSTLRNVKKADWTSLSLRIRELGVPDSDIKELKLALDADAKGSPGQIGPRTSSWMGKLLTKVGTGALTVSTSAAAAVIAQALAHYLGLK